MKRADDIPLVDQWGFARRRLRDLRDLLASLLWEVSIFCFLLAAALSPLLRYIQGSSVQHVTIQSKLGGAQHLHCCFANTDIEPYQLSNLKVQHDDNRDMEMEE